MPRPSFTALIALSTFAVISLAGCKTIYTDMYRPKRNHFKPEKEKPKPTELLPDATPLDGAPAPAMPQAPGLDPAMPAPAAPAAPDAAAPAAPPAIPGL